MDASKRQIPRGIGKPPFWLDLLKVHKRWIETGESEDIFCIVITKRVSRRWVELKNRVVERIEEMFSVGWVR